ncbi:rhodanese domain-containing protein CG4456-like [Chironomus tepperi]|uniref:rhodanese domain-containing protein CG4456-like n=1 Tax=Chironomus tepperi TaxID=113505 RepID=UPI00391FC64E
MNNFLKFTILLSVSCLIFTTCSANEILSYQEVKEAFNNSENKFFDVREKIELVETGLYPVATNVQMVNLEATFDMSPEEYQQTYNSTKPDFNDSIIFLCKKGIRAKKAYEQITAKGYTNVKYYKGSWNEWCVLENLTCYKNP